MPKKSKPSPGRGKDGKRPLKRAPRESARRQAEGAALDHLVLGRNAVLEALKSGHPMEKLWVQEGAEGSIGKILSLAKERGIPFTKVERQALDRMAGGSVHQGIIAQAAPYEYAKVESLLALAKERGEDPFLVILDGVEDPHNLGAILRSAECAGAHGLIIPARGGASLTETVAKASAGAIEYLPVAKVTNLSRTIEELQAQGLWVAACDMGDELYYERDLTGPLALVVGSEGKGLGRLVKEHCDYTVSIPLKGRISSLNASNAAAVLLYEVRRQRDLSGR